ncbi:hypothetical protein, partial [Burkholderia pseudomallei]|uniref:hypothetical protein n=1 Tax=Burkholderia pseudomallei TaxID=28450 RepID=UPI0012B9967D
MTDLIHDFAKIEVPRDLLDQINIDEVLSEFKARFHRLGDLKRARPAPARRRDRPRVVSGTRVALGGG